MNRPSALAPLIFFAKHPVSGLTCGVVACQYHAAFAHHDPIPKPLKSLNAALALCDLPGDIASQKGDATVRSVRPTLQDDFDVLVAQPALPQPLACVACQRPSALATLCPSPTFPTSRSRYLGECVHGIDAALLSDRQLWGLENVMSTIYASLHGRHALPVRSSRLPSLRGGG